MNDLAQNLWLIYLFLVVGAARILKAILDEKHEFDWRSPKDWARMGLDLVISIGAGLVAYTMANGVMGWPPEACAGAGCGATWLGSKFFDAFKFNAK